MMRSIVALFCIALPCAVSAQTGSGQVISNAPTGASIPNIIQSFAAKEQELKTAREQYAYTQDVTVGAKCQNGQIGVYHSVFDVGFDSKGKRLEKIKAASSTLTCIYITKEDVDGFRNQFLFLLTTDEIPNYQIDFVGQQQADNAHYYVFDVSPTATLPGKPYFQGRIWVNGSDFRIVKSEGTTLTKREKKGKPIENLFPAVTTLREQIDGRYWFPTSSRAKATLHFSGEDVQVEELVKLTNFKAVAPNNSPK